jgi:hypothetical protein
MCRSRLAGLAGYLCNACDIDFHEACAGYFKEAVAFLICDPWHGLTLSRIPAGGGTGIRWTTTSAALNDLKLNYLIGKFFDDQTTNVVVSSCYYTFAMLDSNTQTYVFSKKKNNSQSKSRNTLLHQHHP